MSSYQQFQADSYEPGESVDHLKLKAADREIWGNRNIIFADSIQMDMDRQPLELSEIFDQIDESSRGETIIRLPKLEPVKDELARELDAVAFQCLKSGDGNIHIEEFQVHGVAICFSFHDYDYRISARTPNKWHRHALGNTLEIEAISEFITNNDDITDINELSIQFQSEDSPPFTKSLKELLDFPVTFDEAQYFLKRGEWFFFNQTFMDYLKQSLESITTEKEEDLIEADFEVWKVDKAFQIEAKTAKDKLLYREAWFNEKICKERGYLLLDRQLVAIQAIAAQKKKYKVEIADIYKDGEIISVKISESNPELIYNVEQSKTAIELLKRNVIRFDQEIKVAALWFAFEREVNKITDFNSIQFLLAVESWHKQVKSLGLTPKIYLSNHVRGQ
ncbi:TIGR04141 family sporadically distributed protein [Pseudomonas sp. Ap32]|nr:TIGR04141 family sporadically distributed protein [Pseudomonas sp. Ap32]